MKSSCEQPTYLAASTHQLDCAPSSRPLTKPFDWIALSKTLLLLCSFIASSTCFVGCSPFRGLRENLQYNDSMNDFVMGWRNSAWARQAWNERKGMYANEPQFISFGQGFRDGYADVAGGANGCVPGLPPRSFWTWKYQTGEGQAKVAAWFAGYPHGAKAAQEDGAGNFQQIQVSHLIEAQYSAEFRQGKCPGCDPANGMTIPDGPTLELLPGNGPPATLPAPVQDPPPPPMNATTQLIRPQTWPDSSMTRIPRIVSDRNEAGKVVPASYQNATP